MSERPRFGPEFQDASSKLYKAEYGAITLVLVAYLIWRSFYGGGIDTLQTVFWFLFPDLVAFIPIGLSSSRREWPNWGPILYNIPHSVLIWGLAFVLGWLYLQSPNWPILGWLVHISADRAFGYGLRKRHSRK